MKKKGVIDKSLMLCIMILTIFGLIMILSASSMESYMRYDYSIYHYFFRQLIFIIVSLVVFIIVLFIPTKAFKRLSWLGVLGVLVSLIGLMVYGYVANNARSWFPIGPFRIQPSEFAKIFIIMYMAGYYEKNKDHLDNLLTLLTPIMIVIAIFVLVAFQPDLGTALLIMLLTIFIFFAVPMPKENRNLINKICLSVILVIAAVMIVTRGSFLKSYQLARFNFLKPCERYKEDTGYQLCNSFIAFKNGGLLGKGIGESTQKYLYLPESYTDFIFPIIVEEWGVVVGLLILGIYTFMAIKILNIARKADNIGNSLLAYGVFIYFILHIIINLIGVMGLAPLTGVPLPFLSYGGSYCLSLFIAMGLVQRVNIESTRKKTTK